MANASDPGSLKEANVPYQHGHRERLREKFAKRGSESLEDYEMLELLLFRSIPRRDTKPIAKDLLDNFGTLAAVLRADVRDLARVKGVGPSTAQDLKIVAEATRRGLQSGLRNKTILSSWSAVIDYCTDAMAYEPIEQFRILFLDKKNALIADEVQQRGTVDHTPVYPREVIKRALELSASALLLVHNHPSGDPTPSKADIDMTKVIIESGAAMGIVVHDHVIIGKDGHASMKGLQLI